MSDENAHYSTKDNVEFLQSGRMDVRLAEVEVVVVSAKDNYRHLAKTLTQPQDTVLEIGCSTGIATRTLALAVAQVVAVDKSVPFIGRLQEDMRDVKNATIACVDGRNIPALVELMPDPTVIFIDIGGDAQLDNVALQLRLCLRAFKPRLVVVRSFELATLTSLISRVEPPKTSALLPTGDGLVGRDVLSNLLELAHSTSVDTRCFAARRLGTFDMPSARECLSQMVDDPEPRVRQAAARAFRSEADLGEGDGDRA
jgi:precorrin-6B methylase 2